MELTTNPIVDYERIAPGARLANLAAEFYEDDSLYVAKSLNLSLSELAKTYNGELAFTPALALQAEEEFGVPVCLWKRLEDNYRLFNAWGLVKPQRASAFVNGAKILWKVNRLDYAYPPGNHFVDMLSDRGLDKTDGARILEISQEDFARLQDGELPFTLDYARAIEREFGVPASFWTGLEDDWREFKGQKEKEWLRKFENPDQLKPADCLVHTCELLQDALEDQNLSPDDLARKSELPIELINKILSGEERLLESPINPRLGWLSDVADALCIPFEFLRDLETQLYADDKEDFI